MGFNVEDFKSTIGQGSGLAQTNLYAISLPALNGGGSAFSSTLNLLCKAVNLPGRQILTTQSQIGLVKRNISNGYGVEDVTFTFHVLNDMAVKQYFEDWQKSVVNTDTYEVGYYRDYTHDIKIKVLRKGISFPVYNRQLDAVKKIPSFLRNRLPNIGPINLSQGEIDLDFIIEDQVVYECTLMEAYPTTVAGVNLSNDQDQLFEINVSFTYRDWKGVNSNQPDTERKFSLSF